MGYLPLPGKGRLVLEFPPMVQRATDRHDGDGPPATMLTTAEKALRRVFPVVKTLLEEWRVRAADIPSPDLRAQALASMSSKAFHCAGGSMFGLLAGANRQEAISFIVAYQTISDYLDNLCDRSTSLDPEDFRLLHTSMLHALTPGAPLGEYYQLRAEQDDGGYLAGLVTTCQDVLAGLPAYQAIAPHLHRLARHYCALQVNKHIAPADRLPVLEAWFAEHRDGLPPMAWYEFSACSGSTLGIFALVSTACGGECDEVSAGTIADAYFPWVQGLHILLDYLIDQEEDREGGDLNLCAHYPDQQTLQSRLVHFHAQANAGVSTLPHAGFHRVIIQGLLGLYGSDPKVRRQEPVRACMRQLLRDGGASAWFCYAGCRLYRSLAPRGLLGPG